jgi:1-acyl-sn-glycerol-3-phosphate acyltransferase
MIAKLWYVVDSVVLYASLTLLGAICLTWTLFAFPLLLVLPERLGARCGRLGIRVGFRFYVWTLSAMGAYRLDLAALGALRGGPPVVLAPNHPSLIDALLIIAYDSNVACVMKSALMNNMFLGAGARLARYIANDSPRHLIAGAVAELARGSTVLLFPEATRTVQAPINPLKASVAIIAKAAGAPVQTLLIEQSSGFLSKGWSLFTRPSMPVTYRVRLGRRFPPPQDARALTDELERYFREELAASPQNEWIEKRRALRVSG